MALSLTASMQAAADALRDAERVTAICHENPDADTIGAAIAIAMIAERLGKPSEIVSSDRPAPMFDFLPRIDSIVRHPGLEPDLAVICDAASMERVGRIATDHAGWFRAARILNIDHHISNNRFGHVNLVDPYAAATCEVVARMVPELGLEMDQPLATALLTGIVRDSHAFSDGATTGDTLRITAGLVDAGAPLALIHRQVLNDLPFSTISLWGKLLSGIGHDADGRIVFVTLTQKMLDTTGTQQHDADGLVEFLARIKEAEVTLLLREVGPAQTRVSIRTTGLVDATLVAAPFGGGGHARRAGCVLAEPVATALPRVLAEGRAQLGG